MATLPSIIIPSVPADIFTRPYGGGGTITPPVAEGPAMGGGQATPPSSRPSSPTHPAKRINAFPDPGSSFYPNPDAPMLKNMYDAISRLNLWDWLSHFTPEAGKGFMFSSNPEITAIGQAIEADGHSGASFAICMRQMEFIAKQGWIEYYRNNIAPYFAAIAATNQVSRI